MGSTSISCPKGCYQWVVVFCSFFNHMATTGFILSLGVMYVSWLEEFKESHAKTSWILSVEYAFHLGFGPVTASLSSKFGFRAVAFVGGLVTCLGLAIGAFATSVFQLILSVGLVSGTGCALSFLPPYAMISLLFDKRRSMAYGIATTGVGVGTFALPPLLDILDKTYAWRGTLLIVSAVSLNMCVTGLLLRPVEMDEIEDPELEDEEAKPIEDAEDIMNTEKDVAEERRLEGKLLSTQKNEGGGDRATGEKASLCHKVPSFYDKTGDSSSFTSRHYENGERISVSDGVDGVLITTKLDVDPNHREKISSSDFQSKGVIHPYLSLPNLAQNQIPKSAHHTSLYYLNGAGIAFLAGMNSFWAISKASLTNRKMREVQTLNDDESKKHNCKTDAPENSNALFSRLLSCLRGITRLRLLRDKTFLLFCVSNLITNCSVFGPVMYMVDRAIHHGMDRSTGAIIMSANGVGNILGRLFTGLVASDGCFSKRTLLYILVICTNGVGTLLSTMCRENAVLHGIYAAYFGFHIGAYAVVFPMVVVDLYGVTNLAPVLGQILTFQGIGVLIGPPISGWLFDWTQSYTMPYVINGISLIIAGLMVVPFLWKADKNQFAK